MMSRLFTLGMGQGHCTLNPCTGIKKNAETHRDRYLSERELATLWGYLERSTNVEAAACVQFILLTGCRPGEAYTMRWADLDRATGMWAKPAPRTKQRKQHRVRLTEKAMRALGGAWTPTSGRHTCSHPRTIPSKPRSDKLRAFLAATFALTAPSRT